jgi:predicted YcjX-like family ATPase
LFVDNLIAWAVEQTSQKELVGAWKANQKEIDALKKADPALFEHLKTCFTELKANIKE